jgi:hypothetical protein
MGRVLCGLLRDFAVRSLAHYFTIEVRLWDIRLQVCTKLGGKEQYAHVTESCRVIYFKKD